jgi:OmpA-OmpF porin, OOP family
MEINLLEIVKSQLSGNILDKAASFLGEDNSSIEKALSAILPSLLGGLVNQSTTTPDASKLLTAINSQGHDGSLLDSLGMLFGGGSLTQGLISSGESMNTGLFNNKLGDVVDWVASFAGMKAGSASGLMNMAAPVLMGILGKQIKSSNLDAQGLLGLLSSQTGFIKNALPSGIISVLGLSNLKLDTPSVSTTIQAAKAASDAKVADVIHEDTGFNKILPWILFAIAGLAGMFYLRTCNTKAPEPPQATAVAEPLAAPVMDTVKKLSLPDGEIVVKTGSFLDQLYTEASDSTLDATKAMIFDNVNFATGSALLTEDSKIQLDDLVKIMKGYPKVEIKIDGHTDNKGNEVSNKKLSESRAASVKIYLASHGIVSQRMSTAGFGSTKPVAENETEVGRAKNRRIEAFIVKK